ncbi:MAG: hypothetical protein K8L91_27750 [Anaerolineae bacterium]|nr:hypothetical protein [Anaerolineae bacterium]
MFSSIFRRRRLVLIGLIAAVIGQIWFVPAPIHSQAPSPQRIESDDPAVQQQGTWAVQASAQASGGTYLYSSGSPDDVLTLKFTGTAIEIVYVTGPSLGTLAVEIDDTVLRTVITTADSTAYQQTTRLDYLTDEVHTLRVYAQEGGIIGVDAFVLPTPTDPKPETVHIAETETRATICSPGNAIHRVSLTSLGAQSQGSMSGAKMSTDGRFVTFYSGVGLVPGDGDSTPDIYVFDRQTCEVQLVSVSTAGVKSNGNSFTPSISGDGRYVVYESGATNLVTGDTNNFNDIFLHDRATGTTTRVSVDSSGAQSNDNSYAADISADGRFIAFESRATNLAPNDTNGVRDIFLHNRLNGNTFRVSFSNTGGQATGGNSRYPALSADGRYVAFESDATNLVTGDTNGGTDIFVRDRQANTTTRVSVATGGTQSDNGSYRPRISADGSIVVFTSYATNLVSSDTNGYEDVFVYDFTSATTSRVSVGTGGVETIGGVSQYADISDDGRYVAFESDAENLVSGDTNSSNDIFLHDRTTGITTRVSVGVGGTEANGYSYNATLSGDARYIGFESDADNLVPSDTNSGSDIFVTPRLLPADDSLALFNPPYNQVNLIDTLADTPPYTAYTAFSAYAPVSGGTWVMGDWNGDGLDTPGVYLDYVFYYTNTSGESAPSDWGGFWVGVNGPPVAGRFSSTSTNDCIGAVDSAPYSGMTIFALYFNCDFSGTNPAPPLTFQWLSAPLPDPTFTGTFQFMAGDFNGDGLDSVAVRRNEFIAYGNVNPAAGPATFDLAQYIGAPGTGDNGSFVVGDWDGNGLDSFGLFYQNGELFYRNDLDFNTGVHLNQSVGTPFGNVGVQAATWR